MNLFSVARLTMRDILRSGRYWNKLENLSQCGSQARRRRRHRRRDRARAYSQRSAIDKAWSQDNKCNDPRGAMPDNARLDAKLSRRRKNSRRGTSRKRRRTPGVLVCGQHPLPEHVVVGDHRHLGKRETPHYCAGVRCCGRWKDRHFLDKHSEPGDSA